MSLDIRWDLLRENDNELAARLKDWINDRFRELDPQRPAFLGPLAVTHLDFGHIPPTIAIQDITNVLDEFYLPDDVDIFTSPNAAILVQQLSEQAAAGSNTFSAPSNARPASLASGASSSLSRPPQQAHSSFDTSSPAMPPKSKTASVEDIVAHYANQMRRETDFQVEILVDYKGDVKMSVSTELIINHPTPKFITLPMSLTLTGFSFTAVAVVSYLGDRINFCFKENADNRGLFTDIAIDSEIGDKNRQGKVPKN
ncbi:Mitochondrial distribution and morphology protein 12 [Entophlyctis luteolus]|nr:Mitochondrial distribution and morphology protein 12 [Entophlyctis luteolus]